MMPEAPCRCSNPSDGHRFETWKFRLTSK